MLVSRMLATYTVVPSAMMAHGPYMSNMRPMTPPWRANAGKNGGRYTRGRSEGARTEKKNTQSWTDPIQATVEGCMSCSWWVVYHDW